MANYIVTFDLVGGQPEADEMGRRIEALGEALQVLKSAWYLKTDKSCEQVYEHLNTIAGDKDRLLVVEAAGATYRDLLIPADKLRHLWPAAA